MNKIFTFLLVSFLFALCPSCSSSENSGDSKNQELEETETSQPIEIEDNITDALPSLAEQYNIIRDAIVNADTTTLNAYVDIDEQTDAAWIIESFSYDEAMREQLAMSKFEGLEEVEFNGKMVKEFYASVSGEEDGYEFESALMLYFDEIGGKLIVVNFMAAG